MIIKELGGKAYEVQSAKKKPVYLVRWVTSEQPETGEDDSHWFCQCKSFEYGDGKNCKHITAVIVSE